ncbi:uncharacterized protein LOC143243796 isoform X2 [Tachypleus tridentatus]|uniref:uncharacterized protein LOC143243796 isoform X2 n=1 Tax=Tachypleus tridentatus TaxID=6853 RepID=UPI003FD13CD0
MTHRGFGGSPWQQNGPSFVEDQLRLGLGRIVDLMNMERLMRESGGYGGSIGFGMNTGGMDMSQVVKFLEASGSNERVGGYEQGNQRNRMKGRNRSGNRRNQMRRRSRKQQTPGEGQQKRSPQQQRPQRGQKKRQIQQQGSGEGSHPKRQNTEEAQYSPQEKNSRNIIESKIHFSPSNFASEGTEQRFQSRVNGKNQNLSMDQQAKFKVNMANKMRRKKGQNRNTFYCTVCEREYHGSFLQHRRTSKEHRKNRDRKYPKCRLCRISFNSPLELKQHQKTTNHKNLTKQPDKHNATKSDDDMDYVTLDATGIFVDEGKKKVTQCDQDTDSDTEEKTEQLKDEEHDDDDDKPVGQFYVVKVEGYFCKICHKFFKDSDTSSVTHCKCEEHRRNYARIEELIKKRKALQIQKKAAEKVRLEDECKREADDTKKEEETPEQQISTTDEPEAGVEDEKVNNIQEAHVERCKEAENDDKMIEEQGTVAGSEEEESSKKPDGVEGQTENEKEMDECFSRDESREDNEQCNISVPLKDEKQGECDEKKEKFISSELDDILGTVDSFQSSSQENGDDQLISSLVSENQEQENSELVASLSQIVTKEEETKIEEVVEDEDGEDEDDADTSREISSPSASAKNQGKARGRVRGRGRGKRSS